MSNADSRDRVADSVRPPGWSGVGARALGDGSGEARPWQPGHHVLLLVTGGPGTIEVDFRSHPVRPGTLLWVTPGQALRAGPEAAAITFDDRHADVVPGERGGRWEPVDEVIRGAFTRLAADCADLDPGPVAADLLRHQLAALLLRIVLLDDPGASVAEGRTFARFRRLLEDGHPRSRRVEDYAEELGCSVRTLTRACLAMTGRTAKQVVDDRVALQARRMLACTPMSVADVGRHLGFPEPTNFGRFFHREVGTSPGQFRAEAVGAPSGVIPAQRRPLD